jgi:uncharacterized protein (UPF0216 family)
LRDERSGFEKMLRYIWRHEVNKLNEHLPTATIPLSQLLREKKPVVKIRDGTNLWIDQDELMRIASLVPTKLHTLLHLPILLIRRIDLGEGVFCIGGGKLEAFFVARILGITQEPFESFEDVETSPYIYRPQVQELRRKLRSLSVIGFAGVNQADIESAGPVDLERGT